MNRRELLRLGTFGSLAAALPLSAAVARKPTPNTFAHMRAGVTINWSGWRDPVNQIACLGYWTAMYPQNTTADPRYALVSVAPHGRVQWVGELCCIDTALNLPDGFSMMQLSQNEEMREAARKLALAELVAELETIAPADLIGAFRHGRHRG